MAKIQYVLWESIGVRMNHWPFLELMFVDIQTSLSKKYRGSSSFTRCI